MPDQQSKSSENIEDETKNRFIYDVLYNQYSLEWDRTRDIQNKATNIVSFVGLVLSIILATFSALLDKIPTNHSLPILSILSLCLILMLISVILGIRVLNVKNWRYLNHEVFFQKYVKEEKIELCALMDILSGRIVKYISENQELNTTNAKCLRYSYYMFGCALVMAESLFFIYIIYVF